ncbi:SRPBCC family protein [Actinoplanes sp. NPDC049596]|uniref:SRPBCC family protein n=1 Tax=unclassified Actinoplanes TaxID=2626549 RepID=UPI0034203956
MEIDVSSYTFTRRAWVGASPAFVYGLISDVSRIGQWSPKASAVAYDDGEQPRAGAWFSGHNVKDGRSWITRSQVVEAEPAQRFGFVVGGAADGIVRWDWTLLASGDGTEVRQSWRLLRYDPVLGATPDDVRALRDYMADSAESTLIELSRWIGAHHDLRAYR